MAENKQDFKPVLENLVRTVGVLLKKTYDRMSTLELYNTEQTLKKRENQYRCFLSRFSRKMRGFPAKQV